MPQLSYKPQLTPKSRFSGRPVGLQTNPNLSKPISETSTGIIIAEMDTEAPQATEIVSDITSGRNGDPATTALLTSREPRRDTTSDTDGEPAQNETELGSELREIRPLEDIKWQRTSQAAFLALLGLLFIGVLTAISHHLFYSYLNNRATDSAVIGQKWAIRIGTAFAYLFKTALVAAISVVYAQGFWFLVRRNEFEIGTLDDFFALLNNPLRFYNRSLYGRASLLFLLAMISWLIPISAVFAPGALTGLFTL